MRELYKTRKKPWSTSYQLRFIWDLSSHSSSFITVYCIFSFCVVFKIDTFQIFFCCCCLIKGKLIHLGECFALLHLLVFLSFPAVPYCLPFLTSPWIRRKVRFGLQWVTFLCSLHFSLYYVVKSSLLKQEYLYSLFCTVLVRLIYSFFFQSPLGLLYFFVIWKDVYFREESIWGGYSKGKILKMI